MKTNTLLLTAVLGLTSAVALADTPFTIASFPMTDNSPIATVGASIATFDFSGTNNFSSVAAPTNAFSSALNQQGGWGTNSFWELSLNLSDFTDVSIGTWSQRSSNTGPQDFRVDVSFNGGDTFTNFVSGYTVPSSGGYVNPGFSLGELADNNSAVIIRWINTSDVSVNGGTINSAANGGTSRFSNFEVTAIPEPGTIVMVGILGLAALIGLRRRK